MLLYETENEIDQVAVVGILQAESDCVSLARSARNIPHKFVHTGLEDDGLFVKRLLLARFCHLALGVGIGKLFRKQVKVIPVLR